MIALALLAAVPVIMWGVQTLLLVAAGRPVRWRIDSRDAPRQVRLAGRITTQLCLLIVICVYPLTQGRSIIGYYAALLPSGRYVVLFVNGLAASVLCLGLLFLAWITTDRLQVMVHHSRRKWIRRLLLLVPTALFGAFAEELLFRGVLAADLHDSGLSGLSVVLISASVFAVAHYVRAVKRRWTFPGHFVLGCLLTLAFLQSGNLWLAIGLHAGGIVMIMGTRPFVRYQGPAWLTGASIFPFAGVVGITGLLVLTGYVLRYNPTP